MPKRLPPLTYGEVIAILTCGGFSKDRTIGSHEQWAKRYNGHTYRVTIDELKSPFSHDLIAAMIPRSGLKREQFYAGSKNAGVASLKHAR